MSAQFSMYESSFRQFSDSNPREMGTFELKKCLEYGEKASSSTDVVT